MYLGAKLEYPVFNGIKRWTMSSDKYFNSAIGIIEKNLESEGIHLSGRADTPMPSGCRPEKDTWVQLEGTDHTYFQELIAILRWETELGRVDTMIEVSMLSTHLAMPRNGHLEQGIHIFANLKAYAKKILAMDPQNHVYNENQFSPVSDSHNFYRDAKEQIPDDSPPSRGEGGGMVCMHCFVDADHAGNCVTRRSQTGILIFLNRAPIEWYSKRQNTIESLTFGSEYIAMKTAVEMLQALHNKLDGLVSP